jgi:hypothetical protein
MVANYQRWQLPEMQNAVRRPGRRTLRSKGRLSGNCIVSGCVWRLGAHDGVEGNEDFAG